MRCQCTEPHPPRRIVITGGPGAGKTALLELVRGHFCEHVQILPEAASIVFGGGFPREDGFGARRAAQRAIYHVEVELEAAALDGGAAVLLCDRGTLDGLAYWPGDPADYFRDLGSTLEAELARYHAVVHLRTPTANGGYDQKNPLRIESAREAATADGQAVGVRPSSPVDFCCRWPPPAAGLTFFDKVAGAVAALHAEVPACCRPAALSSAA